MKILLLISFIFSFITTGISANDCKKIKNPKECKRARKCEWEFNYCSNKVIKRTNQSIYNPNRMGSRNFEKESIKDDPRIRGRKP
ncbi:MAG: hypothetical protein KDK36_07270 [Leptospiraceae bacterium]|nr:hypothetical protein [Leptospiraceae bacterium]